MSAELINAPVQISEARDLLAAVPYLLGYHPSECVLVVCIHPGGTLGLLARTALSDLMSGPSRTRSAELVARRAREDGTAFAYVVTYSSQNQSGPAAAAFASALSGSEIPSESWHVGTHTYRNLDCRDEGCCPKQGYPLANLQSSVVGAHMVLGGIAPAKNRDQAYRIRSASASDRDFARRSARNWLSVAVAAKQRDRDELLTWRTTSLGLWAKALVVTQNGATVSAPQAGRLAAALSDICVRDAVLASCLPGGNYLADQLLANDESHDPDLARLLSDCLASVIAPDDAVPPDPAALAPAIRLLEAVVAVCGRRLRPAPLTLLALIAWWLGDGGRASYRLATVLRIDPDYQLAKLVNALVAEGVAPGWIRERAACLIPELV